MGKAAKVEGFSRQQLSANFKALEQDLRSYNWYRHLIASELGINAREELDSMLFTGGLPGLTDWGGGNASWDLKAVSTGDIYAVGAKDNNFKPLAPGHKPEYQRAHNLIRKTSNPTLDAVVNGRRSDKRSIIGMVYLRRLIDTAKAILITFDRLEHSVIKEDRIKAEVARMYYMERYKTQSGIALEFSSEDGNPRMGRYPMSQSTVSRLCKDVIEEVAACLGIIV